MEIRSVSSTAVNRPTVSSIPEAVAGGAESTTSPVTTAKSTGAGGYISPFLRYDQGARVAVLLFRDVDTGETQDQIPSQRVVEEYRRAAGRLNQTAQTGSKGTGSNAANGETTASGQSSTQAAAQTGATTASVPDRGISFASFGAASTAASTAAVTPSYTSGSGGGSGSTASVSTPDSGGTTAPPPSSGGSSSSPGGLVSVTV